MTDKVEDIDRARGKVPRQLAKRLINERAGAIRQMGDYAAKLDAVELDKRVKFLEAQLVTANTIIAAMVLRHGQQIFDGPALLELSRSQRRLIFKQEPDRLTISIAAAPCEVLSGKAQ